MPRPVEEIEAELGDVVAPYEWVEGALPPPVAERKRELVAELRKAYAAAHARTRRRRQKAITEEAIAAARSPASG